MLESSSSSTPLESSSSSTPAPLETSAFSTSALESSSSSTPLESSSSSTTMQALETSTDWTTPAPSSSRRRLLSSAASNDQQNVVYSTAAVCQQKQIQFASAQADQSWSASEVTFGGRAVILRTGELLLVANSSFDQYEALVAFELTNPVVERAPSSFLVQGRLVVSGNRYSLPSQGVTLSSQAIGGVKDASNPFKVHVPKILFAHIQHSRSVSFMQNTISMEMRVDVDMTNRSYLYITGIPDQLYVYNEAKAPAYSNLDSAIEVKQVADGFTVKVLDLIAVNTSIRVWVPVTNSQGQRLEGCNVSVEGGVGVGDRISLLSKTRMTTETDTSGRICLLVAPKVVSPTVSSANPLVGSLNRLNLKFAFNVELRGSDGLKFRLRSPLLQSPLTSGSLNFTSQDGRVQTFRNVTTGEDYLEFAMEASDAMKANVNYYLVVEVRNPSYVLRAPNVSMDITSSKSNNFALAFNFTPVAASNPYGISLQDPLDTWAPVIVNASIYQSSPLTDASNTLTVSVKTNTFLVQGSRLTLSGLCGMADDIATVNAAAFRVTSTSASGCFIVVEATSDRSSFVVMLDVTVRNGGSEQVAVSPTLSGFIESGVWDASLSSVSLLQQPSSRFGIEGGSLPLKIVRPRISSWSFEQSSPFVGSSNQLTLSLTLNVALTVGSQLFLANWPAQQVSQAASLSSAWQVVNISSNSSFKFLGGDNQPPYVLLLSIRNSQTPLSSPSDFPARLMVECGLYDSWSEVTAIAGTQQDLFLVPGGRKPFLTVMPEIQEATISQTIPFTSSPNVISLHVVSRFAITKDSRLLITPAPSCVPTLLDDSFTSIRDNTLVLTLSGSNVSAFNVSFRVINGDCEQADRQLQVKLVEELGVFDSESETRAMLMDRSTLFGVINGSSPFVTYRATITKALVYQDNPIVGQLNNVSLSLRFNFETPKQASCTITGMSMFDQQQGVVSVRQSPASLINSSRLVGGSLVLSNFLQTLPAGDDLNVTVVLVNGAKESNAAAVSVTCYLDPIVTGLKVTSEFSSRSVSVFGVAGGSLVGKLVQPGFDLLAGIQKNPLVMKENKLVFSISCNIDFAVGSTMTLRGLVGLPALYNVSSEFAVLNRTLSDELIVIAHMDMYASETYFLNLSLINPDQEQNSPPLKLRATLVVQASYAALHLPLAEALVSKPGITVIGIPGGYDPLKIFRANFTIDQLSQVTMLFCRATVFRIFFSFNCDILPNSSLTVSFPAHALASLLATADYYRAPNSKAVVVVSQLGQLAQVSKGIQLDVPDTSTSALSPFSLASHVLTIFGPVAFPELKLNVTSSVQEINLMVHQLAFAFDAISDRRVVYVQDLNLAGNSSCTQDFFQVTTFTVSGSIDPSFSLAPKINQSGYLSFRISNSEPDEGSSIEFDLLITANLYDANLSSAVQSLDSRVRVIVMGRPRCPVQVWYNYAGSLAVEISWRKDPRTILACQQNATSKTVSYRVSLKPEKGSVVTQTVSSNCSAVQSVRLDNLEQGQVYHYDAIGVNLVGETCSPSLDSSGFKFLALATPTVPQALTVSRVDLNTLNFSWTIPSNTGDGTANRQLISSFRVVLVFNQEFVISTSQTSVLLTRQDYPQLFDSTTQNFTIKVSAINVIGEGAVASSPLDLANAECPRVCGDGLKLPTEGCDDGNVLDGDGCSSSCKVEATALCRSSSSPAFTCKQMPQGPSSCIFPKFEYVKLLQSSTFPDSDNIIYFSLRANTPLVSALHVTLSGLTGTGTPDNNNLPITLYNSTFKMTSAIWTQKSGKLDMTIDTVTGLDGELFLSFTLKNPSTTQAAVDVTVGCIDCVTCVDCSQSPVSLQGSVNGSILGVQVPKTDCERRNGSAWFGPDCSLPCYGVVQVPPGGQAWCECPAGSFGESCQTQVVADKNLSVAPQLVQPSSEPVPVKGADGDGVELPPGALTSSIVVSVQVYKTDPPIPKDQSDLKPVGKVMELKPDGVTFAQPVTIATAITQEVIDTAKKEGKVLEMRFLDRDSGKWVSTGGEVKYDRGAPFLLTKSYHFSLWAAMSGNPPPTTATNASETTAMATTAVPSTTVTPAKSSDKVGLIVGLVVGLSSLLLISVAVGYTVATVKSRNKLYMAGAETRTEEGDQVREFVAGASSSMVVVQASLARALPPLDEPGAPLMFRSTLRDVAPSQGPSAPVDAPTPPSPRPPAPPDSEPSSQDVLPAAGIPSQSRTPSPPVEPTSKLELPLQISSIGQLVFDDNVLQARSPKETLVKRRTSSRASSRGSLPLLSAIERGEGAARRTESPKAFVPQSSLQRENSQPEAGAASPIDVNGMFSGMFAYLQSEGEGKGKEEEQEEEQEEEEEAQTSHHSIIL
ncbi:hypothetical protein GUITHDRAFT_115185 [Guillardia theta CCMP2712]|uniref:Fibronectin type-III domain-containing protein n=1 Tax=Guillardia theta (strain CCMP2712) TaxID=905079 RepID=L1IRA5_GUITC|nr:hypothetical protein GUITHDRAFT_115185 [Guillardia theta CCMP2712]EKX38637.1 hypothetical protein GUITHDRAFT_115185 [Guillardia theta CCMP2712]|eukprot:XP_005825617.1 hypothetical protein GUITHDRAFT_115185 [Guillardia theta CCMP2712]